MLTKTKATGTHTLCWWAYIMGVAVVYSLSRVQLFATHGLYSPPGSFVQGISQARTLEWIAISFSSLILTYLTFLIGTLVLRIMLLIWQESLWWFQCCLEIIVSESLGTKSFVINIQRFFRILT